MVTNSATDLLYRGGWLSDILEIGVMRGRTTGRSHRARDLALLGGLDGREEDVAAGLLANLEVGRSNGEKCEMPNPI